MLQVLTALAINTDDRNMILEASWYGLPYLHMVQHVLVCRSSSHVAR